MVWGEAPAGAGPAPRLVHCRLPAAARFLVTATVLAAVAVAGGRAEGGEPEGPELLRPVPAPPTGGVAGGLGEYATGFEPDEGFVVGFIEGNGTPEWGAFTTSSNEGRIESDNPASGEQHFRIALDPTVPGNSFTGGLSPILMPLEPFPVTVSLDVAISALGGAQYDLLLQSSSQSLITARVRFDRFGNVLIVDNPGPGFQFVDTGIDWTPGPYTRLSVCIDPAGDAIDYQIDGETIYSSVAGIYGAPIVEQVVLLSNNKQVDDHGDFDNLVIEEGLACADVPMDGDICTSCIPVGEGVFPGSTIDATGDLDTSSCAFNDVIDRWYCYTPTCSGEAAAETCSAAAFDTTITVFDACGGEELACNDDFTGCLDFTSRATWPVVAGTTYLVRVAGFDGASGDYTLTIACEPGAAVNDDCAAAIPIGNGLFPFDTTDTTTDGPAHDACLSFGDNQVNQDIWYDYVATCTGELTVSTCGSADYDTRLAVYEGAECPVTDGRLIGCNDDGTGCPNFTSLLVVEVVEGQTYKLRVGGFGANTGSGTLSVSCEIPGGPENNTCSTAVVVQEGSIPFDTTAATTSGLPLSCAAFISGDDQIHNDVWFTYTASCTGELFVDTCGTADFDTRLAFYQGTSCPLFGPDLLACNDDADECADGTSSIIVSVVEGQDYTIRVGGFGPSDAGLGTLQVSFSPVLILDVETDADGFVPGESVLVELRMANLCGSEAAGFQVFLEYDQATLQFEGGAYTESPFGLPLVFPIVATDGEIELSAGVDKGAGQMPTSADALLATLELTSLVTQCSANIQFRPGDPPSLLNDAAGAPIEPLQLIDEVTCTGDVNRDGTVDVDDLVAVILAWGSASCEADANGDGTVNVDDLVSVIISWGPCGGI